MNHQEFVSKRDRVVATVLLLSWSTFIATGAACAAEKPNVLLICVDDLKPVIGCYGDKTVKSPNIDRLAARSVLFERAYCNQAVCSPSRNSLLVGLRPQTLGIYDLATNFRRSRPEAVSLPQLFKQHGWRTEALGKIFHVGHGNTEDAASWSVPHWKANVVAYALPQSKAKEGLTREEALFANKPAKDLPRGAAYEAADVPDNTYPDGALADEAIRRLQAAKQKSDEPFFLAVGFVKPHLPFVSPKKYWDLYDRDTFQLAKLRTPPAGAPSYAPQSGGELRQYRGIPESGPLADDLQRTLIHGYHAATSYMDAQLGRVLNELDRLGLAQNTIIVLWGDHGWHLGDHEIWCKHTNYEQATHIPLLVAAPGAKSGVKTSALAETVDIYPTLCELAGIQAPAGLDGRSFATTLRDPARPTKDHTIHVYPRTGPNKTPLMGRAIRTARHRLVEWNKIGSPAESAELELYDYETDPLETKNLAAEQPSVVAELRALLAKHPEAKPQVTSASATEPSKEKPKQDRSALFNSKDKNKDGKLTREEFLANQPDPDEAPKRFPLFDENKDGVLSREEFVRAGGKNKESDPLGVLKPVAAAQVESVRLGPIPFERLDGGVIRLSLPLAASDFVTVATQANAPVRKELRIGKQRVDKVLFLGNSITLHGPAPKIGWTGNWGMAASAEDKDYVHLLTNQIAKAAGGKPKVKVKNIADFERRLTEYKLADELKEELAFEADVVIVALGENASSPKTDEAKAQFETAFANLFSELKKHGQPRFFVRSQFWQDADKDRLMRKTCEAAGGTFVDISKLGTDEANYARSERKIEHAGVAGHPGDNGMQVLADALWNAIQK